MITVVMVRHQGNPKKFLFRVPDGHTIKDGMNVIVDTKHGMQEAVAITDSIDIESEEAARKLIAFDNAETIASETTSANGYGRLKLSIDLSQAASGTSFAQALFSWDYADTNSFAALTQNDINDGTNTAYQVEICRVSFYNGTISGIVSQIGGAIVNMAEHTHDYAAKSQANTAYLTVEGWEEDAANEVWTQTVNVTGVTASNNIISSPAPDYIEDASECGVYCYAQQNGSLIFVASSQPSRVVIMNILIVG